MLDKFVHLQQKWPMNIFQSMLHCACFKIIPDSRLIVDASLNIAKRLQYIHRIECLSVFE